MQRVLTIIISLLSASAFAQPLPENAITTASAPHGAWENAKKLSLDANVLSDKSNCFQDWSGWSLSPDQLAVGTTDKLNSWIFRVESILDESNMLLHSGTLPKIVLEGYSTSHLSVGEEVVILGYVYAVGQKEYDVDSSEKQGLMCVRMLTPEQARRHEIDLNRKKFLKYTLSDGRIIRAKCVWDYSTLYTAAMTANGKGFRHFTIDDFADESKERFKVQTAKLGLKQALPESQTSENVKDATIPRASIRDIYNSLNERGFSVKIRKSVDEAKWNKGRRKVDILEINGGAQFIIAGIFANDKPGEPDYTDEDKDFMEWVASFPGNDKDNGGWVREHFDESARMIDRGVVYETVATDFSRAVVIRAAKKDEN